MATATSPRFGLVDWADDIHDATPDIAPAPEAAPELPPANELLERLSRAEGNLLLAHAQLDRADSERRSLRAELDNERRLRDMAEQARAAAESRLAEAREGVWRWLARLARTPLWRIRGALVEPPAELSRQLRLNPPE